VKAIAQRLSRLEERFTPKIDERARRAAEQLRELRRRRMAEQGLEFEEGPPIPLFDADGRRRGPAALLRAARLRYLRA